MDNCPDMSTNEVSSFDVNYSEDSRAVMNKRDIEQTKLNQFTQVCNAGLKHVIELASNNDYSWLRVSN